MSILFVLVSRYRIRYQYLSFSYRGIRCNYMCEFCFVSYLALNLSRLSIYFVEFKICSLDLKRRRAKDETKKFFPDSGCDVRPVKWWKWWCHISLANKLFLLVWIINKGLWKSIGIGFWVLVSRLKSIETRI